MIPEILKEQLSALLGNLSVFYSSSKILNSINNQITNLEGKIDNALLLKYKTDYEKLKKENTELDNTINDIITNSGKINDLINKISNFSLSIDYIKSFTDDYGLLEKYATVVPQTLTKLNDHIENLETLQLAILNQTGQYSLKTSLSLGQKIIIGSVVLVCLIGVYINVKH